MLHERVLLVFSPSLYVTQVVNIILGAALDSYCTHLEMSWEELAKWQPLFVYFLFNAIHPSFIPFFFPCNCMRCQEAYFFRQRENLSFKVAVLDGLQFPIWLVFLVPLIPMERASPRLCFVNMLIICGLIFGTDVASGCGSHAISNA